MSGWGAARGLNWYSLSAHRGWLRGRSSKRRSEKARPVALVEVVPELVVPETVAAGRYRIELGDAE